MTIPLVAMIGLLAYVAGTLVDNAINLDRAPSLINATSLPTAEFINFVQSERAAAVVYLFQPTSANLAAYNTAVSATDKAETAFKAAMTSKATVSSEDPAEAKAIDAVVSNLGQLRLLRAGVQARAITPLQALAGYSQGIAAEPKLFMLMTNSEADTSQLGQALGLITTVQAREQLSQEDALLAGMLAGRRMTQNDRVAFTNMAAARQADTQYAAFVLSPANLAVYNASLTGSGVRQQELTNIEQAIAAGTPVAKLPITQAQWQALAGGLLQGHFNGGIAVAQSVLAADHKTSHSAWVKVALTSGFALLGLLLTILVTSLVARGIIRRLRGLEHSALTLAEDQLPAVISRLRRGEGVDVASVAPPPQVGRDEIGRVGQAFDLVRQTAIRAAVEESKLRQGLNDVFRSLARRSQSLLHRQLTLLDQMERRATDPEALDDLFRLDHLTTRMRRHAEGLVILAGAPPGRGWSSPVRMVDVMRGAIAEVEDYARVSVATRSQASLSGSAVADVIHLLAELIENATTLSPPYTSVRVSGDTVANGFAIEVEDRGLGMSPQRLAELNDRLASPPEFNPSDSEQLGLFVVSQLAKRHGIRVTLKVSPYGGTAAVVLVPRHLVVAEEALRASLPGEPAAITMAHVATNGNHEAAAEPGGRTDPSLPAFPELHGVPGLAPAPGVRISGPLRRSQGIIPAGGDRGAHAAPALGPANGGEGPGPDELPRRHHDQPAAAADQVPHDSDTVPADDGQPAFDVFMPRRRTAETGEVPAAPHPGNGSFIASSPYPASGSSPYPGTASAPYPGAPFAPGAGVTPFSPAGSGPGAAPRPGAGPVPYPDQPAPFPGWNVHSTPGASSGRGTPSQGPGIQGPGIQGPGIQGPGIPLAPVTPMTPVASPRQEREARPPWDLSRQTGPLPVVPDGSGRGSQAAEPGTKGDIKGLPRRVRQASLAPQLRGNPPYRQTTLAGSGSPASGPSPAEIRQTMSALQRGWQEGRSQRAAGQASGDPAHAPSADASTSSSSDSSPGAGGGHESTADEEARGESDGT